MGLHWRTIVKERVGVPLPTSKYEAQPSLESFPFELTCRFWKKKRHILDFTYLTSGNNDQHLPTLNLRCWIFCLLASACSSAVAPLALVGSGSDLLCSPIVVSSSSGWPLLSTAWLMSASHDLPAVTFVLSLTLYESNSWVFGIVIHGSSSWNQKQI